MENAGNDMKRFILTLVHIRKRLVKSGKSKKNAITMNANTAFLKAHIEANNYNNEQMIRFFARHSAKIYSIIPGEESKCGAALLQKFSYYYSVSQQA